MDYSDNEVKGIPRYLPDTLSKSLAVSVLAVPCGLFAAAPESIIALLPDQTSTTIPLGLLAFCLAIGLLLAVWLILHLILVINHSKHGRIRHYTAHPESMDLRALVKRFSITHYSALVFIFLLGVGVGYLL